MSTYDLILRSGILVTPGGSSEADLAIEDGRIAAITPDLEDTAREEVDASGLHASTRTHTSTSRAARAGRASPRAPDLSQPEA